ncbi:O-antigen ligase [Clostridium perfringens]|nr:O-antigen ligase [Clostridium perfringens]
MKIFTIALILIYNIIFIYQVFKKKNIFGLGTIINFSINLNFILYLCKWSRYIESEPYIGTYILVDSIIIIFIIIMLLSKSPISNLLKNENRIQLKDIRFFKNKISLYVLINIVYILLFLIENFIGSGSFIPYLLGIDIHTYSAPLISFITRALYVIIFLNYIAFDTFKEKKYFIFFIIDILLFPVLRGGRVNLFMAFVQFSLFFVMYNLEGLLKNKKKLFVLLFVAVFLVISGVVIGNKRVDKNLEGSHMQGEVTYKDHIKYDGPIDKLGIMPWYYGYFPMSFANLNKTIEYIDANNIRTNGIYSVRPILVGMFQCDNLIPEYKDIEYASSLAQYYTTAATVRTGFMEFYLDFGYLAFIPICIFALIGLYLYNSIRSNIYFLSAYAFFAGCWFFMSFQNMMIDVTTLYGLVYLYLLYRFCVRKI